MAVGLYSGVSGLALGIGLYRNVSGLWGGASGLIDGFGGADPYAGASLYLNFLDPVLDSRITFSRGTNATLIDSTGRLTYAPNNQLLSSEDFDAAYWAKARGSITANVATAPNGTTTADLLTATSTGTYAAAFRSGFTFIGATQYVYSVYAKASVGQYLILYINETGDVGRAIFDLNSGAISAASAGTTASITPVGNGWWRCVVSATPSTTTLGIVIAGVVDSGAAITVTSGKSILLWGAQLEQVTYQTTPSTYVATTASAYYGPRFDYDPVTLAPRGLLIEEARTNLLTYSDDWSNAAWVKQQVTISANATLSPDGTANADKIAEDNTTAFHRAYQTINKAASAIAYVYTVYVKAAERTTASVFIQDSTVFASVDINLVTGALSSITGTASATNAGNGWWRVSVSGTSGAFATALCMVASNNNTSFAGTTGSGIYVWGAQAEAATFATSYIPTVASTVTRNADVATMTGTNFSSWYNQSEGTFVTDYDQIAATVSQIKALAVASDGTSNNRIYGYIGNTGQPTLLVVNGGATQANPNNAIIASGPATKTAFGYKLDDFAIVTAGGAAATDTSGTVPTTVNRLDIGNYIAGAQANGHIRTIAYFNTRLPNAQLQTLTAPSLATTLSLDFTSGSYNVGF